MIGVEYNNVPVGGTPFTGKAYDHNNVIVSPIPWGTIGKSLEFTVDASRAGEGNLEITISARGRNIPTQVRTGLQLMQGKSQGSLSSSGWV